MGSESEDSDEEGGLNNVKSVIIRPPGQSGKAKKGHLCFDAAFETGNLGQVILTNDYEYDLCLRPDTCNPRFRFWFNFTVDNCKQDQRVIFTIGNFTKSNNLFSQGMTPLVKSSSRPKWQRLPKEHVFYYKSPIHKNHHVLSFAFFFDREDDVYQFALSYPYSYSRLQAYLSVIEQKFPIQRDLLINSVQGRRVELITFDDVKKPEQVIEPTTGKKNPIRVVVVMARMHPMESPTSYVMQGLIEFLAIANHPIAKILRENVVFKILPMMNPDGVFLGNNRTNCLGHDMNRYWNQVSYYTHPPLSATLDLLREYDHSECYQLDFVVDFHAHATQQGTFIIGNAYEDVYRYERHLVFPKLFSSRCADYNNENMIFNADDRKQGTARRYLCNRLNDNVNVYTLQVSMNGFYIKGTNIVTPYTETDYMKIGRNFARSILEYYRFTNIIAIPMLQDVKQRKGRPKSHRPHKKFLNIYPTRPRTTRENAPISYTDLSIYYDSDAEAETYPARFPFHSNFMMQHSKLRYFQASQDHPFSVPSSKQFENQSPKSRRKKKKGTSTISGESSGSPLTKTQPDVTFTLAPKPYLSIIDFNMLTRGGLDEAVAKSPERTCPHHQPPPEQQQLKSVKITRPRTADPRAK